jgi:ParB family transcriptional regulator, chromosome partitioning protein
MSYSPRRGKMEPSVVRNAIDAAQTSEIAIQGISITASRMKTLRPETVVSLANSLRTQGLLHPIVLRRTPVGYYLIAGLHRLEAARQNQWEAIRAKIVDIDDAFDAPEAPELEEIAARLC